MSDETWTKARYGGLVALSVDTGATIAPLYALPEWLIDRILADHAAARQVETLKADAERLRQLIVRADSMLSYIRHRGPGGWQQTGAFDLSVQEVDDLIGALRKESAKPEPAP